MQQPNTSMLPLQDGSGHESAPSTPSGTPVEQATPEWIQYIPEAYRGNPDRLREAFEYEQYGRRIAPHHKTFESVQQQWNEFQEWRRGQAKAPVMGTTSTPTAMPAPTDEDDTDVDYTDPEAVRKALRQIRQQVKGYVEQFGQEVTRLGSDYEQGQKTIFELIRIKDELRDLQNQELFAHAKFTPTVNPQELAKWMLENGVNDSRRAYELLYGKPSLEAKVKSLESQAQEMYNRGKADAEQALANQRVTMESSAGTPWRLRTPQGRSTNEPKSLERRQEILDRITEKIGAPREQAS
jgi:hypothetical protein